LSGRTATDIERPLLAFFLKRCFVKEGGQWARLDRNPTHRAARKFVELNLAMRKEVRSELLANSIYQVQRPFVVVRKIIKFNPYHLARVSNSNENGSTLSEKSPFFSGVKSAPVFQLARWRTPERAPRNLNGGIIRNLAIR
jgi:hypothetical protein